ncbi:MAG: translation initiation factor [Cyclobacteriaceae bacterium]
MGRKKENTWKNRDGVVYSTSNDFEFVDHENEEKNTLAPSQQNLRVLIDKKSRGGKQVTLITGFIGREEDLKTLGKQLKTRCGVGGNAKDGEIIIQGDQRDKIIEYLKEDGFKVKKSGG